MVGICSAVAVCRLQSCLKSSPQSVYRKPAETEILAVGRCIRNVRYIFLAFRSKVAVLFSVRTCRAIATSSAVSVRLTGKRRRFISAEFFLVSSSRLFGFLITRRAYVRFGSDELVEQYTYISPSSFVVWSSLLSTYQTLSIVSTVAGQVSDRL